MAALLNLMAALLNLMAALLNLNVEPKLHLSH
jgi:hypothetical protein